MNKVIKSLFFIIADNQVLYVESTIKDLHEQFSKEIDQISYITLYRAFKERDRFTREFNGKTYYFQSLKVND